MTSAKKLTTVEIVDKFSCPESELLESANEMAEELTEIYKWSDVFVQKSSIPNRIEGKIIHHFFDIYGSGEEVEFLDPEAYGVNEDTKENESFAAKDVNL